MTEPVANRRLVSIVAVFVGVFYIVPVFLAGAGIGNIFDDGLMVPDQIALSFFAVLLVIASGMRFFRNSMLSLAFCGICSVYLFAFELTSGKEPMLLALNFLLASYFLIYAINFYYKNRNLIKKERQSSHK